MGLLTVEDLIPVDNEEASKLGEHRQHVDPLEEVDVDVGHPELVDELDVHRHVGIVRIRRRSLYTGLKPSESRFAREENISLITHLTPKYMEKATVNLTSSTSRIWRTSRSTLTLTGVVGTSSLE